MFVFKKLKESGNPYDNYDVIVSVDGGEITITDLQEIFDNFLRCCGYVVDHDGE